MNPIEFKESNIVFGKNQPEYLPLPAHYSKNGTVTSCWQLTPEELEKVKSTGKIFISQSTFGQPLQPIRPALEFNI